ncbi:MAG: hypothetical protein SFV21_00160 [Rhodospirillaceae bacterium]|nr:hypothetical protein [Rhodospirillaceae bacterium]
MTIAAPTVAAAEGATFQPCGWFGRDGVAARVLRRDGAGLVALMRYPAGWRAAPLEYLEADEAFLVLNGALVVNGTTFARQAYGAFSAFAPRLGACAPDGATVLAFFSAPPHARAGMTPPAQSAACRHDAARDVARRGLYLDGWDDDFARLAAPFWQAASSRIKLLRRDPADAGADTLILGVLPIWRAARPWRPATALDLFVIEGDLAWDSAVLTAGAYAFIPAGAKLDGLRSTDGATLLIRSRGGGYGETG